MMELSVPVAVSWEMIASPASTPVMAACRARCGEMATPATTARITTTAGSSIRVKPLRSQRIRHAFVDSAAPVKPAAICDCTRRIFPMILWTMAGPTPSRPTSGTVRKPVTITQPADRAAEAMWRRLCAGARAPWLDDIGRLRADGDDPEASLDIWSVALAAALKDPARRQTAASVLARLRKMGDQ